MGWICRLIPVAVAALGCVAVAPPSPSTNASVPAGPAAAGFVFEDLNANRRRDPGEPGLSGVAVSNGRDVVVSDAEGRYRIGIDDDTIVFVIKPRGYVPPLSLDGLPRFFYTHKPAGSATHLAYPGVAPSGPLPASLDFAFDRHPEPDAFSVILFADTQPYDMEEVDYTARDIVEEVIGTRAEFGITLGDVVGDDLALFEPLNRIIARIGVPWYNVHGNHDIDFTAADDAESDEAWERVYGPTTYAFQVGAVHFAVLDDIFYLGAQDDGGKGGYEARITDDQLAFLEAWLATVPRDELVVLTMHVPLEEIAERRQLLELLSGHERTLSISGHSHMTWHAFYGPEDGYLGPTAHHHLNQAAVSGSWWKGLPDELGIPHATMRDGAPNGWSIIDFDARDYRVRFKAARRPADYQMNIVVPDTVSQAEAALTEIVVNVFAGSERSSVEMRIGPESEWQPLNPSARLDPEYIAMLRREASIHEARELPPPQLSRHIWAGTLGRALAPGTYTLEVRTTDMFGQRFEAKRLLRVTP